MTLSLREYSFAIFCKSQAMGRRAFAARELAARTLAGRGGQQQALNGGQGGRGRALWVGQ